MFDLAMMTAPASRNFLTRNASSGGIHPASDREPAAVCISAV